MDELRKKFSEMNKGKRLLVAFMALTIFFMALMILRGSEDDWICENGEWAKHGVPSAPKPSEPCP